MEPPVRKTKFTFDELYEVLRIIKEYIEGDCWAITINGEIIYNNYDKTKKIKKLILQDMLRNYVSDKPRLLFGLFEKDKKIVIYMFGNDTWTVNIIFEKSKSTFELFFFKK
jgi:hydroxymethylpyrimidine pyrophosphatase-like HAD family hydrolase